LDARRSVQMPCAESENSKAQHIMTFFDGGKEAIQETASAEQFPSIPARRHDNGILAKMYTFCWRLRFPRYESVRQGKIPQMSQITFYGTCAMWWLCVVFLCRWKKFKASCEQ